MSEHETGVLDWCYPDGDGRVYRAVNKEIHVLDADSDTLLFPLDINPPEGWPIESFGNDLLGQMAFTGEKLVLMSRALLKDATGDEAIADAECRELVDEMLAHAYGPEFEMQGSAVLDWLERRGWSRATIHFRREVDVARLNVRDILDDLEHAAKRGVRVPAIAEHVETALKCLLDAQDEMDAAAAPAGVEE